MKTGEEKVVSQPSKAGAKPVFGGLTLAESIAECLRFNIERGSLCPGVVLRTAELARFFNVSRIPVARAIEELEEDRLVHKRGAQGYAISGGSAEQKLDTSAIVIPDHLVSRFDRQPSWERVYDKVETELLELMPYGRFQINESALTAHYDLNRGQTQQIVTRLCERGVAEKLSQSHCNLLAYDEPFLRHRYELRALLEPVAIEKASAHISKQEAKTALERHIAVAQDFPKGADRALPKLERQLHIDFLGRCSNPRIIVALEGAQVPLIATTRMILRVLGSDVEEPLLSEHIAILEPLAKGNPAGAAASLRAHLESSCERSVRRLSDLVALPEPALPPFLRKR
ncbi:MAG: GntR family transcriptional regulator [Pseudomonadota bacterium]